MITDHIGDIQATFKFGRVFSMIRKFARVKTWSCGSDAMDALYRSIHDKLLDGRTLLFLSSLEVKLECHHLPPIEYCDFIKLNNMKL